MNGFTVSRVVLDVLFDTGARDPQADLAVDATVVSRDFIVGVLGV
jgi:hypothetical protein